MDNLVGEIQTRISHNIAQVDRLYEAGLISQELSDSLKTAIESQAYRLKEMAKAFANEAEGSTDGGTTVNWLRIPLGIQELNRYSTFLAGSLHYLVDLDGAYGKTAGTSQEDIYRGDKNSIGDSKESYDILSIDDTALAELESVLDYEVYVLKRDPLGTGDGVNDYVTLDVITKEIDKAKSGKNSNIDQYFVSTGKKVWDKSKPENQIIKETVEGVKPEDLYMHCQGLNAPYTLLQSHNTLQEDLILVQTRSCEHTEENTSHTILENAIGIRLKEFNNEAIDRLIGGEGVNKNKYVVVGNRAYLMEYPVNVVTGFSVTDGKWQADYAEVSDLKVNILTGAMYGQEGKEMVGYKNNNIYSVLGGDTNGVGKASFIVDGIKGKPTQEGYIDTRDIELSKKKANSNETVVLTEEDINAKLKNVDNYGRIVLRDYKELSYMPGVYSGEDLVALGRTVRLTKFKGEGDTELGVLVGKALLPLENSITVKISDVMDIERGLLEGDKYKLSVGSAISEVDSGEDNASDGDVSNVDIDGGSHSLLLDTKYTNTIKTTTRIPGDKVAIGDSIELGNNWGLDANINTTESGYVEVKTSTENTEDGGTAGSSTDGKQKQLLYAMSFDLDPFASNMFSGWVNISGVTKSGSLDWWNTWLKGTTFNYNIDRNVVMEYFMGNYVTELQDNGYVILDLAVVNKIQQEMDSSKQVGTIGFLTASFVIIGYFLLVYAVLLPLAWLYDVNITLGVSMLGVLTFNKWVATTEELSDIDESKRYMSLNAILFAAFKIIVLGIILINVDITMIVNFLVSLFGGVSEFLGDLFLG